ncbi:MAG: type I methionyl aminopeptidase [Candidatus Lloydbacteria bacterium RIFCSPHIGHO2_02_FULL_51_22]|uniref:Methionine aminopeptidase n=3 Tax=Candidatus Lloydiibacteriota TaxID=1817910 RepID=A0A1G2DB85_9BACT|nr:MAG: type I methionyl aminopeptidase [Candidatus Lloydbacteria bacterium RIFCSPHIGHO2_02_FULL_51_22]OGZ15780.1 MAG: type I methionyl aminopeptidase [Candidatus Lloydbacteria bacterium RIFCSPLOWO2_02_FULL_51_11]OGZ17222.1 MAG: type I methionyl aminopeptidase [Candidatus Lloydbacteria bacterium RIFCSPLOWO2_12_FULL_51_9]
MAIFTSGNDIQTLKEAGRRLARILDEVAKDVRPGVTEKELDEKARRLIEEGGDTSAFLGYTPRGAKEPYPATLCVSVNDKVVHGIPSARPLKEGDIVAIDIGLSHEGIIVDMAKTYAVGRVSPDAARLIAVTEESLAAGIAAARARGHVGDIGHAVETLVQNAGFEVVYELGGHGVGKKLHEGPFIPNFGTKGRGEKLTEGMVLALEPIVTLGSSDIELDEDGYTYTTKDGSLAAHFEHTILLTEKGAEVITKNI